MSGYNNTKCCNGDMFKVPCWKTVRENATKRGAHLCGGKAESAWHMSRRHLPTGGRGGFTFWRNVNRVSGNRLSQETSQASWTLVTEVLFTYYHHLCLM